MFRWFLWVILGVGLGSQVPAVAAPAVTTVVAFGDSLTDYGNNGFPTNTPYTVPSSAIVGTWAMQFAAKLNLPLTIAADGGTNFAKCWGMSNELGEQVDAYLATKPLVNADSLYIIWLGGNDIIGAPTAATAQNVSTNISKQISRLAGLGARNFLWVNIPAMRHFPLAKLLGDPTKMDNVAKETNAEFVKDLPILEAQTPGIHIVAVDAYNEFQEILKNKEAYGLDNVDGACLGDPKANPDKYLFWDGIHPTTRGHQIMAEMAYKDWTAPEAEAGK